MITKLLLGGTFILWVALTIGITIWWRSKFIYIYGGNGAVWKSWYGTLIGAGLLAGILVSIVGYPLALLDKHCPYLLDVFAVGGVIYYMKNKKKTPEGDADKNEMEPTGDSAVQENNNGENEIK